MAKSSAGRSIKWEKLEGGKLTFYTLYIAYFGLHSGKDNK